MENFRKSQNEALETCHKTDRQDGTSQKTDRQYGTSHKTDRLNGNASSPGKNAVDKTASNDNISFGDFISSENDNNDNISVADSGNDNISRENNGNDNISSGGDSKDNEDRLNGNECLKEENELTKNDAMVLYDKYLSLQVMMQYLFLVVFLKSNLKKP